MEYIISPIWVFLELLSIVTFLDALLLKRGKKVRSIISFLVVWLINSFCAMFEPGIVKQIIIILAITAMSFLLYHGSWLKHIIYVFVAVIFVGIIDTAVVYGMCALLNVSYVDFVWRKLQYVITVTAARLLVLLFAHLFRYLRKGSSIPTIQNKWLLLTALFPATSMSSIVVLFVSFQNQADIPVSVFIYACILAIANVAILYLIQMMEKQSQKERQMILMNQQMEVQTKSIIALERSYRDQRRASHEFMHQLQTIVDLLDRSEAEAAQQYIYGIQGTQRTRTFPINTHHPILDAIFNQKYQAACEQETEMQFHVNDLSEIQIATDVLVVVFSNLLDNALEACLQVSGDRRINCSVINEGSLFVSIRNTSPAVNFVNGYPETTKEPKEEHGFGLKSVSYILDGLHAEYTIDYKDGWFQFVAEIPLGTKE